MSNGRAFSSIRKKTAVLLRIHSDKVRIKTLLVLVVIFIFLASIDFAQAGERCDAITWMDAFMYDMNRILDLFR